MKTKNEMIEIIKKFNIELNNWADYFEVKKEKRIYNEKYDLNYANFIANFFKFEGLDQSDYRYWGFFIIENTENWMHDYIKCGSTISCF